MIVVSYYTPQYLADATRLRESCERFDIPYRIKEIEDRGSWRANIMRKAETVTTVLLQSRRPVLWLDADCEIVRLPSLLFQGTHDFATYNWHGDPENALNAKYDPNTLLSSGGVMLFGYTAAAIELLIMWQQMVRAPEIPSDDQALDAAFNQFRPPVNPLWLPKSYNRMDSMYPDVEPIIDHHYTNGARYTGAVA